MEWIAKHPSELLGLTDSDLAKTTSISEVLAVIVLVPIHGPESKALSTYGFLLQLIRLFHWRCSGSSEEASKGRCSWMSNR